MIFRTGTRKNYGIWFLPTSGISSCGISQGKIISLNWLLCYRFFDLVILKRPHSLWQRNILRNIIQITLKKSWWQQCFISKQLVIVFIRNTPDYFYEIPCTCAKMFRFWPGEGMLSINCIQIYAPEVKKLNYRLREGVQKNLIVADMSVNVRKQLGFF